MAGRPPAVSAASCVGVVGEMVVDSVEGMDVREFGAVVVTLLFSEFVDGR